ncbi:GGDEF domain-containing protein [Rhizobium sp. KVB221]|uniref:diguanylate cyclase n=1 Tax=Rhizobium setariae TaxID=2801340 RepID=A0A936YJL4_9HYPH|nr:GGDEF domain-containing protein [Rhizobium setariae]MBL0371383.1 GGDEF domain-containing protein [Rhizobium setariae]
MPDFFSILTVMLCSGLVSLVLALVLSFVWLFERNEKAVGWWCAAMWMITVGFVLLAFRTSTPIWFGIALGNAAVITGYALVGAGFLVFARKKVDWRLLAIGPGIWILSLICFEAVRADFNLRIMIISAIVSSYTVLAAFAAFASWKEERLPSALLAVVFYGCHAVFYSLRIPLAHQFPLDEVTFLREVNWFTILALEAFLQSTFTSFVFLVLIRERSERRYKLAAEVDSLTSVANRRYFVSETGALLARKPKAASLAVLDLDYFKKINDTYGHMAGDRVLQIFARYVESELEDGMVFGRLGGEEFGLFVAGRSEDEAVAFIDKIRTGVEALDMRFNGHVLKVTTSIGIASIAEAGLDFDHLMAGADNALYVSKREGRNRASVFHPAMRLQKIFEGGEESRISLSKKRLSRISVRSRPGRA